MKVIYDIFESDEIIKNSSVAIGNFDGLHLGHKALVERVVNSAKERGGVSVIFTFLNHTKNVIDESQIPKLINTTDEKIYLLEKMGVDYIIFQPFTISFCALSGEEFVRDILGKRLGAEEICVGFNFRFGKGQANGIKELKELGTKYHMHIKEIEAVKSDGKIISSTLIRNALLHGDISAVNSYLGEPYIILGQVIHGKKLGRVLGFPTANLEMKEKAYLPYGIYGGYATIEGVDTEYDALINIGRNPTLKNEKSIEVHLLDFNGEIYGKTLVVHIIRHIRDEIKFKSMEELKERIATDIELWREYLENIKNGVDMWR